MRTLRSLAYVLFVLSLLPTNLLAQRRKEVADDFVKDVLSSVFGPNWNLSLHAGSNSHGRFLLQRLTLPGGGGGERTLRSHEGFTVGGGAGVDILLRTGLRVGYTYGSSDMIFRSDIGNGSEAFDVDEIGELESHSVSVELLRYMLPSTASFTPYASAGFIGTWYSLESQSSSFDNEGATQFRTGAIATLGLKVELSDRFDLRFEAGSASMRNPFTGRDSYRVQTGTTIDEPTRVNRSSLRFVAVYNFGKPEADVRNAARRSARRR